MGNPIELFLRSVRGFTRPAERPVDQVARFSQLLAERDHAQYVLQQRRTLYERIGTGNIGYDPLKVETLPQAIKVGHIKELVKKSIGRIEQHVERTNDNLTTLITKENAWPIIDTLLSSISHLEEHSDHIPQVDVAQFRKLVYKKIRPFIERAIAVGSDDPRVYIQASNAFIESAGDEEGRISGQALEEYRRYLKKAMDFDKELAFPHPWYMFADTFRNYRYFYDFRDCTIEEVIDAWRKFLEIAGADPDLLIVKSSHIEFAQREIERLTALAHERDMLAQRRVEEIEEFGEKQSDSSE